ncbi:MAG: hypothetical protein JXC31_01145 [Acholeplasmataceae bacterium]|nr:hypothetical protein [Acholeplasmataceae bacterium]
MKLNPKIYKKLTSEPFEKQEVNGKIVEFYYMNDTPYLYQYAARGRFAVWTSDGRDYKVLIEKAYYEALGDFYQLEVNKIWLKFLENVGNISKKVNMWFIVPTLVVYVIAAGISSIFFAQYMLQILLGLIVLVVVSNIFQSRIVNKKVREENQVAQNKIRDFIGVEAFDDLVTAQEKHYQEYFKFDEEEKVTDTSDQEIINDENQIEDTNVKDSDD